jgi:phenylalanyl-tRNA synthetase beta chain
MLKTVHYNKKMALPIKVFEISDVVLKDPSYDVGARNERRLCLLYYGVTSGFELVHGVLDRLMQVLDIEACSPHEHHGYYIEPSNSKLCDNGGERERERRGERAPLLFCFFLFRSYLFS